MAKLEPSFKSQTASNTEVKVYETKYSIDIKPNSLTEFEWAQLAKGITNVTPNKDVNETTKSYLSDNGGSSTSIDSIVTSFSLSGDRLVGDKAQDWLYSDRIFESSGAERKTKFKKEKGINTTIWDVTLKQNIEGGEASATESISIELACNGQAYLILPVEATMTDETSLTLTLLETPEEDAIFYMVADDEISELKRYDNIPVGAVPITATTNTLTISLTGTEKRILVIEALKDATGLIDLVYKSIAFDIDIV